MRLVEQSEGKQAVKSILEFPKVIENLDKDAACTRV